MKQHSHILKLEPLLKCPEELCRFFSEKPAKELMEYPEIYPIVARIIQTIDYHKLLNINEAKTIDEILLELNFDYINLLR
ncbi:MAG: hypothetical protein AB1403_08115 [Candidatus Riflebacteria bacterium]